MNTREQLPQMQSEGLTPHDISSWRIMAVILDLDLEEQNSTLNLENLTLGNIFHTPEQIQQLPVLATLNANLDLQAINLHFSTEHTEYGYSFTFEDARTHFNIWWDLQRMYKLGEIKTAAEIYHMLKKAGGKISWLHQQPILNRAELGTPIPHKE